MLFWPVSLETTTSSSYPKSIKRCVIQSSSDRLQVLHLSCRTVNNDIAFLTFCPIKTTGFWSKTTSYLKKNLVSLYSYFFHLLTSFWQLFHQHNQPPSSGRHKLFLPGLLWSYHIMPYLQHMGCVPSNKRHSLAHHNVFPSKHVVHHRAENGIKCSSRSRNLSRWHINIVNHFRCNFFNSIERSGL